MNEIQLPNQGLRAQTVLPQELWVRVEIARKTRDQSRSEFIKDAVEAFLEVPDE